MHFARKHSISYCHLILCVWHRLHVHCWLLHGSGVPHKNGISIGISMLITSWSVSTGISYWFGSLRVILLDTFSRRLRVPPWCGMRVGFTNGMEFQLEFLFDNRLVVQHWYFLQTVLVRALVVQFARRHSSY